MINRRSFIKKSTFLGAASLIGPGLMKSFANSRKNLKGLDIAIVNGEKYFENTKKAVKMLGGMKRFVSPNSKVGLLINNDFTNLGAYVNPDVSIAVLKMCYDAGASEVVSLQNIKPEYWERSTLADTYREEINNLKIVKPNQFPAEFNDTDFELLKLPEGNALKELEIVKELLNCDVLINIPIAKHHASTSFTCGIKNMMGLNTRKSNVYCHTEGPERLDPIFLGQCLAEMSKFHKSDLIVVDAIEFIITNGPNGPGKLIKLNKVVAGTDIVGVDSLCASYLDYPPEDIVSIKKAYDIGLGEIDLNKLNVQEFEG